MQITSHNPDDTPQNDFALEITRVSKRFAGVVANREISIQIRRGSFHAIIGENGAGKSTLLNLIFGRYSPDEGEISIFGEEVAAVLKSPADAIQRGIGLVSQHYSLIPALTVFENIVLGSESTTSGGILNRSIAEGKIQALCERMRLGSLDLSQKAERLSVAAGQKIEILKALYRDAKILLLDEPTATLAPQEAETLFNLLTTLLHNGTTIVFVTHKLQEVRKYSQEVTVLRHGAVSGHFLTAKTTDGELLQAMIGGRDASAKNDTSHSLSTFDHSSVDSAPVRLFSLTNVSVRNMRGALAVENAFLEIRRGEIVGVAGVDGSGQRELSEAIVGLRRIEGGEMRLENRAGESTLLNGLSVRKRQRLGVSYIPENRHRDGMILDFNLAENYLLGSEDSDASGGGLLLRPRILLERVNEAIKRYDVRLGERDGSVTAKFLSGGNQQKIVVARALSSNPALLIACQPTRGLDIEASRFVYETLATAKKQGLGILLFSLDMDELLKVSDRIVVMFDGKIAGSLSREEATANAIGELMTGGTLRGGSETSNAAALAGGLR